MLKIPAEYDRDTSPAKLAHFLAKFPPASLLGVSVGIYQRALVDESGMIRTQMGTHNRSEIVSSAWDALYIRCNPVTVTSTLIIQRKFPANLLYTYVFIRSISLVPLHTFPALTTL